MYIYLNNKQQTTKHIENKWDKKRAELEKQAEIAGGGKMDVTEEFDENEYEEEELPLTEEEVPVTEAEVTVTEEEEVVGGGEPLGTAAEELARLEGLLAEK